LLAQIEQENVKKAEAIEIEDFELAAKSKKIIDSLKVKLLSPQSIQNLLKRKPALTMQELMLMVLDCDSRLHFTDNLIA
jgi:hypothetical protein